MQPAAPIPPRPPPPGSGVKSPPPRPKTSLPPLLPALPPPPPPPSKWLDTTSADLSNLRLVVPCYSFLQATQHEQMCHLSQQQLDNLGSIYCANLCLVRAERSPPPARKLPPSPPPLAGDPRTVVISVDTNRWEAGRWQARSQRLTSVVQAANCPEAVSLVKPACCTGRGAGRRGS
jgi:hypothetical protein